MSFLIHQCIDIAAERNPDHPAATFLGETLGYAELVKRSNQLAQMLIREGVQRHDRVGIYMDKCIHTPVALYGIMKSGAAYVPLDPSAPPERTAAVITDCGITHLVSGDTKLRGLRQLVRQTEVQCVIGVQAKLDAPVRNIPWSAVAGMTADSPQVKILESDLAYIIYTSGSTGTPKGIMHTHHSGLSFARWAVAEYGLVAQDRLSNHAPLHFDLSIFDYFAAAVAGATTVIIPEEYTRLAASYTQLLQDQQVSVLFTVPFALIQMLLHGALESRDLNQLRWIIFGGEPFPAVHLRALMEILPHARFDNMYGPAEINGCTHYTLPELPNCSAAIPIGAIAECAEALVVDADDNEVERGAIGELLVRTPTMMQGYWGRPDLNKAAFFRQTGLAGREQVFYRTGDLVCEGDDGVLAFIGRKDRQVKVRGYRIELDEIELVVNALPGAEEVAAFTLPDEQDGQRIVVHVLSRAGSELDRDEILGRLKNSLPWYAVPAEVQVVEFLPRTTTGKIDRTKLKQEALREEPGISVAMPSG